jgi:AraC-like DNA-binding protein
MYREIAPNPQLQPFVECFWTSRTEGGAVSSTRVLPDGCVDLIFDLAPGFETAFWVGTMTRTVVVETSRPRHLLGVRFHPGGAKGLLDLPLKELTDQRASFQSVTPFVEEVLERLLGSEAPASDIVEHWLVRTLVPDNKFEIIQSVSRRARQAKGNVRVGEIAASLGLSSQYLNRVMNDGVGVDLKTFCRIVRMRACTDSLRAGEAGVDWSAVAVDFGFYDQSHLIHEFNDLVGLSPGQFVKG